MGGARVTRVSIFAVRYAAARGRCRGVPPLEDAVPHCFGSRFTPGVIRSLHLLPQSLLTIRYFMDTRRRRGRKSDAEPIDW